MPLSIPPQPNHGACLLPSADSSLFPPEDCMGQFNQDFHGNFPPLHRPLSLRDESQPARGLWLFEQVSVVFTDQYVISVLRPWYSTVSPCLMRVGVAARRAHIGREDETGAAICALQSCYSLSSQRTIEAHFSVRGSLFDERSPVFLLFSRAIRLMDHYLLTLAASRESTTYILHEDKT